MAKNNDKKKTEDDLSVIDLKDHQQKKNLGIRKISIWMILILRWIMNIP